MMENSITKFLSKILSKDQKIQLKSELSKYNEIKMSEAMLADGTKIEIEGELVAGSKVYVVSEIGKTPAPDATHEVVNADGTITLVTTVSGAITEVRPKEVEMSAEDKVKKEEEEKKKAAEAQMQSVQMSKVSENVESLNVKLSSVEKENKELKTELASIKESVKVLLSAFETISNTPVEDEVKVVEAKEKTAADKVKENLGLKK